MTQLTPLGIIRTRLDERLVQLQAAMRGIFGEDINLDPDTIDGQALGVFAEAISNLDQLAEDLYHCINPQSATGAALSRIVQLNSIRRIGGTFSTVDLLCVGQTGTVIPAGSLVKSTTTNATFETVTAVTIPAAGQILVSARATEMGAKAAPANTLTKIDTPIFGWQTVTNQNAAILGRDEETDEALRIRRRSSTATAAQGIIDSVYGALANLPGVTQVEVYENELDEVDVNDLPPHSMYCVVEGGLIGEIAQAIWVKKSSGVTLVGGITATAIDSRGNPHAMKFSRPDYQDIYVTVNGTIRPGWPTDGVQRIKDKLVAWCLKNQKIGKELIQSQLFNPVNEVPGASIDDIFIGLAPGPASEANIAIPFDGLARFDQSRIVVNIV